MWCLVTFSPIFSDYFLFTFTKCRNHFLLPCIWSLMFLPQLSTIQACSWIGIIEHLIQIWTSWCFRARNIFPSIPWTLFPDSDQRRILFNRIKEIKKDFQTPPNLRTKKLRPKHFASLLHLSWSLSYSQTYNQQKSAYFFCHPVHLDGIRLDKTVKTQQWILYLDFLYLCLFGVQQPIDM